MTDYSLIRCFIAYMIRNKSATLEVLLKQASFREGKELCQLDVYIRPELIKELFSIKGFELLLYDYYYVVFESHSGKILPLWMTRYIQSSLESFFVMKGTT